MQEHDMVPYDRRIGGMFSRYAWFAAACVTVTVVVSKIVLGPIVPIGWAIAGLGVLYAYIIGVSALHRTFRSLPSRSFTSLLFMGSCAHFALWVVGLYIFFVTRTGTPFEFGAADSLTYHRGALGILDGRFPSLESFDDWGGQWYYALCYGVSSNSILVARLINAVCMAASVVLLYKVACQCSDNKKVPRLAAIMGMMYPGFGVFAGYSLKESILVFVVMCGLWSACKVYTSKHVHWRHLLLFLLSIALLLFLQPSISAALIMTLVLSYALWWWRYQRTPGRLLFAVCLLGASAFVALTIVTLHYSDAIQRLKGDKSAGLKRKYAAAGAEELAHSSPVQGTASVVGPFPGMIYKSYWMVNRQNQLLQMSAYIIRSVLAVFALFALFDVLWDRDRQHAMSYVVAFFFVIYLCMITVGDRALDLRLHLPAIPVYFFLVAKGMRVNSRRRTMAYTYALGAAAFYFIWNYVRAGIF